MKKFRVFIVVCVVALASLPVSAQYSPGLQDAYNFGYNLGMQGFYDMMRIPYTIHNQTGTNIGEVYISRVDSDYWGYNQYTDQEYFKNGEYLQAKSDDAGPYDIMLVDAKGNKFVKQRVRITNDAKIVFTKNDRVR